MSPPRAVELCTAEPHTGCSLYTVQLSPIRAAERTATGRARVGLPDVREKTKGAPCLEMRRETDSMEIPARSLHVRWTTVRGVSGSHHGVRVGAHGFYYALRTA